MTYGYGEPGSPSPDGEPDEWDQSYRSPRPTRRDAYPPAPPPQGGGATYGEPSYRDHGAPASGPAYGGSTYGAPASGPGYGGQAYGAPAPGPAYGAPASGPAYGGPEYGGRDPRDPGYDAGREGYGNSPDGRRHAVPSQPGEPQGYPQPGQPGGYQQGYRQPGYQEPAYQEPGYQQQGYPPPGGRGPARPGYAPTAYQASGYPTAPTARPEQPGVYGRPGEGWQDPGYRQNDYQQQGPYRGGPGQQVPGQYGRRPNGPLENVHAARNRPDFVDEDDAPPPRRKLGRIVYGLITVVVVLALAGFGYAFFIRKNPSAAKTVVSTTPAVLPASDPILSQKTDPKALTADEVFTKLIHSSATGGDYTVEKSEAITGCANVATTKIQALLTSLGCTQVVRANLLSPDGRYTITAGIVNMPDEKSAASVRTSIGSLVTAGKDHFNTLVVTPASAAPQPTTHLGWDSRGHYVFYVVIGLASGDPIATSDERTPLIISDIVETYLSTTVIGAREKTSPTTAASK